MPLYAKNIAFVSYMPTPDYDVKCKSTLPRRQRKGKDVLEELSCYDVIISVPLLLLHLLLLLSVYVCPCERVCVCERESGRARVLRKPSNRFSHRDNIMLCFSFASISKCNRCSVHSILRDKILRPNIPNRRWPAKTVAMVTKCKFQIFSQQFIFSNKFPF